MNLQLGNNKNATTHFLVCEESMTELKRIDVFVTDHDTHLLFTLLVNEKLAVGFVIFVITHSKCTVEIKFKPCC